MPFIIGLDSVSEAGAYNRAKDTETLAAFHTQVEAWSKKATSALKSSVSALIENDIELSDSIRPNLYSNKYGEYNRIGFSFKREGIYVHQGAGRGFGGTKGSKWIHKGVVRTTNPESFGRMGSGGRTEKKWFDPTIKAMLPELADIVANYCADMAINIDSIFID